MIALLAARLRAYAPLTGVICGAGILVHALTEGLANPLAFEFVTPAHIVMAIALLALTIASAVALGAGCEAAERGVRVAAVRATLSLDSHNSALALAAIEALLASSLLFGEGASIDPARMGMALIGGLLAALCVGWLSSCIVRRLRAALDTRVQPETIAEPLASFVAASAILIDARPRLRRLAFRAPPLPTTA